jgi:PKHD-type hydroxylase
MSRITKIVNNAVNKHLFTPQFIVDHNFFNSAECDFIATYCSNLKLKQGEEYNQYSNIPQQRRANIAFIETGANETQWLFEKFNNLIAYYNDTSFDFDITGYDYMQYAKYGPGDKHDFHMDLPFGTRNLDYFLTECFRKLSVILLLNEPGVDFEGGNFEINHFSEQFPINTNMKKGTVLIFPSFMIHRVAPITSGIRQTISVWPIGPKFR